MMIILGARCPLCLRCASASPPPGEKKLAFDEPAVVFVANPKRFIGATVVFVATPKRFIGATVVFVANPIRHIEALSLLPNGGGAERCLRSGGGTGEPIMTESGARCVAITTTPTPTFNK